jgi:hypothetical protein
MNSQVPFHTYLQAVISCLHVPGYNYAIEILDTKKKKGQILAIARN